jgi:hypothetical protein
MIFFLEISFRTWEMLYCKQLLGNYSVSFFYIRSITDACHIKVKKNLSEHYCYLIYNAATRQKQSWDYWTPS